MEAENLFADKGYGRQEIIIDTALTRYMGIVMPPKRNCKERRKYARYQY